MTWFKVDDNLHSHSKIRKILAEDPAALALWTVAGSWSSDNLTDGFVPDHQLPWLIPTGAEELARKLVTAGLWRRVKGGYQFHQWAADGDGTRRNPTREEVENERRKKAEAGRKGGLARANNASVPNGEMGKLGGKNAKINQEDALPVHGANGEASDALNTAVDRPGRSLTSADASSTSQAPAIAPAIAPSQAAAIAVLDPPTRPDHKNNKISSSTAPPSTDRPRTSPGSDDDEQFTRFWATYPRRIGKGQARKAWAKAVKTTDPEAIIEAAGRFTALRGNEDPKFTAHPATWLNGERWDDVPDPEPRPVGPIEPWDLFG